MRLSLITACRNCADTLGATLASVRAQRGVDLEYLVVDGASEDGTRALVEGQGDLVDHFLSEPDAGVYHALNRGLGLATGEVVGVLHGDDLLARDDVLARVAACFRDPRVELAYGDLVYVARRAPQRVLRYWRAGAFAPRRLHRGWMPPHPTVFVRRRCLERTGGYDTSFSIAADYEWILRLLSGLAPDQVAYLPQVLVRMRRGGMSNGSLAQVLRKSAEDYRALRRHRVGGAGALAWKNLSKLGQFLHRPQETTGMP